MTSQAAKEARFYVYAHIRRDSGRIFYIGKGCGRRAYAAYGRSEHWNRIVAKHGHVVKIIKSGLSEDEAFTIERDLIARRDDLCNATDGGEGVVGYAHTDEAKNAIRDALAGRKQPIELVERRAALLRGKKRSPEFSAWLSGLHKGRKHTDETKERMRIAQTGRKQSAEAIEKTAAAHRGAKRSNESRQRMADSQAKKMVLCVETGKVFDSITHAAVWLKDNGYPKATKTGVWFSASGKRKRSYGYQWEYYGAA